MPSESGRICQTRRPAGSRGRASPDMVVRGPLPDVLSARISNCSPSSGSYPVRVGFESHTCETKRNEMPPEDLLEPDLFSEIVLLCSGGLVFLSLLLIVVSALTRV
jgi:hypothetical protein